MRKAALFSLVLLALPLAAAAKPPVVVELYTAQGCASCGGIFNNYAIIQGVDKIVPVDVYIPGCPPRPEALLDAVVKLQKKIAAEPASLRG